MPSKRVVLLAVVCVVVVVTSLVISTSAFTTATLERTAEIRVGSDASALLALIDGHPDSDIVRQDGGTLTIDFTNAGPDGGIPPGVVVSLGSTTTPASDHAFRIVNQGSQSRTIMVRYTLGQDATDEAAETRNLQFELYHDKSADGTVEHVYSISEHTGNNRVRIPQVAPGDAVYVVIVFDTNGLTAQSDLSGSLRILAGSGN